MRQEISDLIDKTILFKYELPNHSITCDKSAFSTDNDFCYECRDDEILSEIIYNSIVDYSFNEFEMNGRDYNDLMPIALSTKIKYNPSASRTSKISYGFHGETILFCLLYSKFKACPVISRGFFYNPLESSETKGYDSYHLVENGGTTELWFGEVKFRKAYKSGIDNALDNIEKAISDNYLSQNFLALHTRKNDFNISGTKVEEIVNKWDKNPVVEILDVIKTYDLKLIYPILILYDIKDKDYDNSISELIDYIKTKHIAKPYTISVPYSIYFIFLPVQKAKNVKTKVIEWIESRKPLL